MKNSNNVSFYKGWGCLCPQFQLASFKTKGELWDLKSRNFQSTGLWGEWIPWEGLAFCPSQKMLIFLINCYLHQSLDQKFLYYQVRLKHNFISFIPKLSRAKLPNLGWTQEWILKLSLEKNLSNKFNKSLVPALFLRKNLVSISFHFLQVQLMLNPFEDFDSLIKAQSRKNLVTKQKKTRWILSWIRWKV